jgi:hypothetical protein
LFLKARKKKKRKEITIEISQIEGFDKNLNWRRDPFGKKRGQVLASFHFLVLVSLYYGSSNLFDDAHRNWNGDYQNYCLVDYDLLGGIL